MRLMLHAVFLFFCTLAALPASSQAETTVRLGYFPNITHAHALIARNMAAEGKGWFEERIPGLRLEWVSFNAGPSAMEALFAKTVDLSYVGPNPALNAHIRSRGEEVRVVAGAVRGGAALVRGKNSSLAAAGDFRGKRIATPQLGNTQDIACRHWLSKAGLAVTMTGGEVSVIPTPNAAMPALLARGDVEAAWTVEPWVSRLEQESGGTVIFFEPPERSLTTVLVSSRKFMENAPDLLRQIINAHRELSLWIQEHPEEARQRVAAELTRQTRRTFPLDLVVHAWPRLVFDDAISTADFAFSLEAARDAGFIKGSPDISALVVRP